MIDDGKEAEIADSDLEIFINDLNNSDLENAALLASEPPSDIEHQLAERRLRISKQAKSFAVLQG